MGCQGQPSDREVGGDTWASQASSLPWAPGGHCLLQETAPFLVGRVCAQVCAFACARVCVCVYACVFAFEANRSDVKVQS